MLYMLGSQIQRFYPQINRFTWNFHEAGHGKGAPDGVGAVCKRTADKFVALGRDISSTESLVKIIEENCPGIRVHVINNEAIDEMASIIARNAENIIPFKGILKVHQICGNVYLPDKIGLKSLSCFCKEEGCNHYKLGELRYRNTLSKALAVDDIYSASENEEETANPGPSGLSTRRQLYSPGDFVLVQLSGKRNKVYRYAAICSGDTDEDEREIQVTFLRLCDNEGTLFKVDDNDIAYVPYNQILYSLPQPELVVKGDRYFYKFSKPIDIFEK